MVSARTAGDRAAFVVPLLRNGARLLDVGCGPGSITLGLARSVGPDGSVVGIDIQLSQVDMARRAAATSGITNAIFQEADAKELPFDAASFDLVFSHALFEHLSAPCEVLAEMARVLRPHGVLAICSSDWSRARIEPDSPDVLCALRAHFALRRRAGGDPFAGGRLPEWISAAGFSVEHVGAEDRVDMSYPELATYVGARIQHALSEMDGRDPLLEEASMAAQRWASSGTLGTATQRWVHAIARR